MLKGVDVSSYQSADFDFSPYDFGIVKASEGASGNEQHLQPQANKCLSQGKLLGVYHYARPEYNTAKAEADFFLSKIKPYIGKCFVCLDWENTAWNYPASWALEWLNYVQSATGLRGFFYSSASYINHGTGLEPIAAKFPLWIAQYGVSAPQVAVWNKWLIWQYSDNPVDQDYFNGTRQELQYWQGKIAAEWITRNGYLRQVEKENNAQLIWEFFRQHGWTLESVCGMLGNMEVESTLSPGVWGGFTPWGSPSGKGYGLVQWTPYTRITNWLTAHGYPLTSGPGQCSKIQEELDHPEIERTWHTAGTPYTITFKEFSQSNASPAQLAQVFLACYERPANPNQPQRSTLAMNWYSFLRGAPIFEPRLNSNGMSGNSVWYSNNPFYQAGYGLPNCTCYVWGRWWEITGARPDKLSVHDGRDFYPEGVAAGIPHGSTPQLGAIACWEYTPGGHVAVVEQINSDGSIVISESGYGSWYFNTETLYPPDYTPSWVKSLYGGYLQGFLYLDTQPTPPDPVFPPDEDEISPGWIYYLKII